MAGTFSNRITSQENTKVIEWTAAIESFLIEAASILLKVFCSDFYYPTLKRHEAVQVFSTMKETN